MNVAETCRASKQSGNALVILLLLKSWEGAEQPTRDELAALLHVSPRQAERHLTKLEAEGEIVTTHARGRGQKTRYCLPVNPTHPSDKSMTETSDLLSPTNPSDISVNRTKVSYLSDVKSDRNDRDRSPMSDTSDALNSGTKVAPYSDLRTSKDITQPTVETRAKRAASAPSGKAVSAASKLPPDERAILEAWRSTTKRYPLESTWAFILSRLKDDFDPERLKRCGGAYIAHNGMGQKHVAGICDWYADNITEPRNAQNTGNQQRYAKPPVARDLSIFPPRS